MPRSRGLPPEDFRQHAAEGLHCPDGFNEVIVESHVEAFFHFHHDLHLVQGIRAQVRFDVGVRGNPPLLDIELFGQDVLDRVEFLRGQRGGDRVV